MPKIPDGWSQVNLRLPTPIRDQVCAAAEYNRRSLNNEIVVLVEEALRQRVDAAVRREMADAEFRGA